MPARCPADVSQWHAASERGLRRLNADATAVHSEDGRTAYVVADGVGDTEAAARAARVAAQVAARTAVTEGPVAAILAAQQAVADGDCVLVVAVPDGLQCDIAWVGDCRAYHSNGRVLQQITVDHTVAEYYRARNGHVEPRMEHLVTTSVRTVKPEHVGTSRASLAGGRVLLCSDGVHRSLTDTEIRTVIDQPTSPAWAAGRLVSTALTNGASDNATALVIDLVLDGMADAEAA